MPVNDKRETYYFITLHVNFIIFNNCDLFKYSGLQYSSLVTRIYLLKTLHSWYKMLYKADFATKEKSLILDDDSCS